MAENDLIKQFQRLVNPSSVLEDADFKVETAALIDAAVSEGSPAVRGLAQELVCIITEYAPTSDPKGSVKLEISPAQEVLGHLISKSPDAFEEVCNGLSLLLAQEGCHVSHLLKPCLLNRPQDNALVLRAVVDGINSDIYRRTSPSLIAPEGRISVYQTVLTEALRYVSKGEMIDAIEVLPHTRRSPYLVKTLEALKNQQNTDHKLLPLPKV